MIAAGLEQDIHLWLVDTAALPDTLTIDVCSAAEQARAARFAARADAARYLQVRALLRHLLSAYSGLSPEAMTIDEGKDGKPFVRDAAIAFNLSHSGPCLVIVLRAGSDAEAGLGVDVQQAKAVDELALGRSLFADSEIAMLEGLRKTSRRVSFFRLWVCREAVLKASGLGMKGRGFELRQDAHGAFAMRALAPAWSGIALHEFQPRPEVFGALAWKQRELPRPQIRQFAI